MTFFIGKISFCILSPRTIFIPPFGMRLLPDADYYSNFKPTCLIWHPPWLVD